MRHIEKQKYARSCGHGTVWALPGEFNPVPQKYCHDQHIHRLQSRLVRKFVPNSNQKWTTNKNKNTQMMRYTLRGSYGVTLLK